MVTEPEQNSVAPLRCGAVRGTDVAVALFGGALASVVVLVAATAAFYFAAVGLRNPLSNIDDLVGRFQESWFLNLAAVVVSDLAFLAVVWWVARRRYPRPFAQYFAPANGRSLLLAALSGLAAAAACESLNAFLSGVGVASFHETSFERLLVPHSAAQAVLAFSVVVLFAPFVEEFFYRGLLLDWLQRRLGWGLAVLGSAIVFAASHGFMLIHNGAEGWVDTAEVAIVGVIMASWAVRMGSLRASLAVHAAFNAASMLIALWSP